MAGRGEGGRGGEDDRGHRRRDNLTRVRPKKKGRPRWGEREERRRRREEEREEEEEANGDDA